MSEARHERTVQIRETFTDLYGQIDELVAPLLDIHIKRLNCGPGCCRCCRDDVTVFEVEAENLRLNCGALLREAEARPPGACAFLDGRGNCRIYRHRPYVCRTQGLPLRWREEQDGGEIVEYRDICPLNAPGMPVEELAAEHCWPLGPVEDVLVQIQERFYPGSMGRVALRSLFG
jgi:Fe-S-cluster containining protein